MSYILEALKKSQAERELGHVPTLDTSVIFEEDKAAPKRGPWVPVALGLAAAAMLLALYAALRDPVAHRLADRSGPLDNPAPETLSARPPTREPSVQVADPVAGPARPAPPAPVPQVSAPESVRPPSDTGLPTRPSRSLPLTASIPPGAEPPPSAPLVEAPSPKAANRAPIDEPADAEPDQDEPEARHLEQMTEAELDAELERELERQLAMEPDAVPEEPEEPPDLAPTPVPRELIQEIESFKDQVRRGTGKAPASARQTDAAKVPKDPKTLRLTRAQEAELPEFLMTVHVYVPDKARRFVLINGLKYGEGDRTREDLIVEQILQDGAVLSFQGNPFYVHR